jgi:hypothetical protein
MKFFDHQRSLLLFLLLALSGSPALDGQETPWPDAADPLAGMGVNIHFIDAKPGELEMLSRAGFHWVRMDCSWGRIEKKPGAYDFSDYDRLLASLDRFHIRAVLILDYGNDLYDQGMSPHTDAGRAAYARWAAALATHFQGRGVVWEIWNEPNIHFWKPHPNADDYAKLALTACQAIQQAAPGEFVVGPALSGYKIGFIEAAARAGIMNYWRGITIHPYFRTCPESYGALYDRTRELIRKYAPPGKKIDVMCGESGYSTSWWGIHADSQDQASASPLASSVLSTIPLAIDDQTQGKYLARLFLFNVLSGVPLTIWYDWHNDGTDPSNQEHNFGIVRYDYHAGAAEVYDRKPAYDAALTYSSQLAGFRFQERLSTASKQDFVLSFAKNGEECLVAWTADWAAHDVTVPAPNGAYVATSYDGRKQTPIQVTDGTMTLLLNGGPQYVKRNDAAH